MFQIAQSMVSKMKSNVDKRKEAKYGIVKDLMKHRLKDANDCIKTAKVQLKNSRENLDRVVRKGTLVRNEFMDINDKELNEVWTATKKKNQEKVIWNIKRHKEKIIKDEGIVKGVIVGDKELEEFEKGTSEKVNSENKAVVYGGVKVNKNEEVLLTLPPDFSTFPKVDIEEFDTEIEKCMIKCQWEVNREERAAEQKKASEEASNKVNEEKADTNMDDKDQKHIDFRNIRATEFKNNKRVILPQPGAE